MQRQFKRRPHARRSTWVWIGTASLALGAAIVALLLGTSVIAASSDPSSPSPVTLGEKLFADASLSASGAMSCATCHDPAHAHAQSNDLPVQLGGQNLDVPGFRAVPSLQYISLMPAFAIAADGTPSGGFNRDGRAEGSAGPGATPTLRGARDGERDPRRPGRAPDPDAVCR